MQKRMAIFAQFNHSLSDLLLCLCLLVAGWKYTNGLDRVMDLSLYDETSYLLAGVTLWQKGLPSAQEAPFYALWYFLQSLWQPDRLQLFYSNAILLTIATPLLIYWLLRCYHLPVMAAGAFAYLWLLSHANLAVWPKSNNFALLVVLLFFLLATGVKTTDRQLALLGSGALISAYARPELLLSFLLLALLYMGRLIGVPRRQWGRRLLPFAWIVLLTGALWLGIGLPFGERSLIAFGQFYAVNWVRWTGSPLSPWLDWQPILQQSFGNVQSVGDALLSNPILFLRHATENALQIPAKFVGLLFVHAPVLLPKSWSALEAYLLLAGFLSAVCFCYQTYYRRLRQNLFPLRLLLVAIGCYAAPALLAAVIVAPRSNYLLIAATLVGIGVMLLLFSTQTIQPASQSTAPSLVQALSLLPTAWRSALKPYLAPGFGLALLWLTPATPGWFRDTSAMPNRAVVDTLAALALKTDVKLLEAEGGYGVYLGDHFQWVAPKIKTTGFNTFLQEEPISVIVLSNTLLQDVRFVHDPEWQNFLQNFQQWGYTRLPVLQTDRALLVANHLLDHNAHR